LGLSRSVLYELLQRYRRRPQTSSLLPWKRGRTPNDSLLGDEREALLNTCIDEFYLRPERPSLAALHLEVRRRFAERVLAVPNYRTVRRRVEAVDARTALRRRDGAKRAREKLGPLSVSSLQPQRPMELVQIDHTLVDVTVVDRENRQPIGRPWLTLAIDVKSIRLSNAPVVRLRLVVDLSDERSGLDAEAAESSRGGEAGCGV
jgi:putative transposase